MTVQRSGSMPLEKSSDTTTPTGGAMVNVASAVAAPFPASSATSIR